MTSSPYNSWTNLETPLEVISVRILGPIQRASNFRPWCLSLSKSRTRTKSPTLGWVHCARVFPSSRVWFSDIDLTAKVRCSSRLSTNLSILNPSFNSSISLCKASAMGPGTTSGVFPYTTLHFGTKPSIISAGVKPCKRTSLPLTDGRISGILRPQIVLALGPLSNTHFLTWLMTNCIFLSTKLTEEGWLIRARICVVPWDLKKEVISAPIQWEPLSWKMQRENPKTEMG